MPLPRKTTAVATFFDALRSPSLPSRTVLVNSAALLRDAQAGLAAAERLRGYGKFLEQARSTKAKSARGGGNIDREVCAQSRRALEDANTLAVSTLRSVRNMHQGGALASVMDTFRESMQRSGALAVADIWEHATGSAESREMFRRSGISDAMGEMFNATVRATDLRVSADANRVIIVGSAVGTALKADMTTTPRPAPARVTDLLFRGRFEALADAFESGKPAYLAGLGLPDHEPRPEEVALAGVLASYHDTVRHVRKLEDIGLSSYRGAGAIAIAAIIVGALLLVGLFGFFECAKRTDSPECVISKILWGLGFLFFMYILVLMPDATPPSNLTGSPVVHGVVRDFVLRSS